VVLEEVTKTGQRKPLAQTKINFSEIVGDTTDDKFFKEIEFELKGYKDRIQNVKLGIHLAGVLLKTGEATDEDLQSLASMLSTNTLGTSIYIDINYNGVFVKILEIWMISVIQFRKVRRIISMRRHRLKWEKFWPE
jgi:hypothetical protein